MASDCLGRFQNRFGDAMPTKKQYQNNHASISHRDRDVPAFKCSDYFRVMAFARLTCHESLRDIVA